VKFPVARPQKRTSFICEGEKQESPHFVGHIFLLALLLSVTKAVMAAPPELERGDYNQGGCLS
jgi:hypothetical protein